MKKVNIIVIFILLSISLSESYMPKVESSRDLSFISSYGTNGSESFGIVSQNLMYDLSPKLELFGGITLQIPMGSSGLYHQDYENNFNGAFSIGTKYKLSNNASITFQCLYSTRGMKPYDSNNYLESITR